MKRVLVTGARGFLGQACVRALRRRRWEVVGVSAQRAGDDAIEWRIADLRDEASVSALMHDVRPTHLLHAAWRAVHGDFMRSPANLDWLKASLSLVQAFRDEGGQRCAAIGSAGEYDWAEGLCRNRVTRMLPGTIYGACKHALHIALEAYADTTGMGFVWPRVFFVYGPGEHETRLVASVTRSLLRGEPAECTHGLQVRDYLHVDDVAEGIVRALDSDHLGAIDIAGGAGLAVRELVREIGRQLGREDLVRLGARPSPAHDARVVLGDPTEALEKLGWKPAYTLEEGIADTIAWGRVAFANDRAR